ncbi:putative peptidoglycan binding protein [Roseiarcus fermentans]|uniref:Putative peptidoglycan binding protein n=1 Tax=Roseiarcus fermentans TaxID=1473586 RepID=A0A366FRZ9_9HYPH|nr:L,D-transpeptidase family protein [Roseiarcus fermentans]RBP16509.1 putative peptidoglycan binding protein [Roseiarcus fermentans]
MRLRVLLAGVACAPLLTSAALAETPAAAKAAPAVAAPQPAGTAQSAAPASTPASGASTPAATATPVTPAQTTPTPENPAAATTGATPAASPAPGAPATAAAAPPKPKKVAPPPPPLETALSTDPDPTLQPNTFFATAKASERYGAIVDAGGWPTDVVALHPGDKGPQVAKLRKRLAIEGDLDAAHASGQSFDPALTEAVKRFQARMGLKQTGVVAGATLKDMNVSAKVRFRELASSADRLAGANFEFGPRYVVVNLPSTAVEAVENGKVAHRYVAIVGGPDHPSPEISAHIQSVNLNPTWTVPTSIIKKEIIPHMQRDPGYLSRAKIRILDGSGQEINPKTINWNSERAVNYTLRQDSGAGNSLGSIRINMPNKLAVYMHDTPSKRLFGADYRFLSHGCVRVQGVYDYAQWLLEGTPGGPAGQWDKAAMQDKVKQASPYEIHLAHSVPVIWVYLTGWSNGDGAANFRDDVYGMDTVGGEEVASAAPAAPAALVSTAPRPSPRPTAAASRALVAAPAPVTATPLPPAQ